MDILRDIKGLQRRRTMMCDLCSGPDCVRVLLVGHARLSGLGRRVNRNEGFSSTR